MKIEAHNFGIGPAIEIDPRTYVRVAFDDRNWIEMHIEKDGGELCISISGSDRLAIEPRATNHFYVTVNDRVAEFLAKQPKAAP